MKKKTIAVAILLVLAMLVSGCGKEEESSSFGYDKYIDENGFWKDVVATDVVTLCDYNNIDISQNQVDEQIAVFHSYYPNYEDIAEGVVADGDTLNIDYVGKIDGVEFDGGNTNGAGTSVTIGVTSYIDDFLEQLIGHKIGETFDIEVTFPDEYPQNEDLQGKDAVFTVTINSKQQEIDSYDDDYVYENFYSSYGWETQNDMKNAIIENLVDDYIVTNSEFGEIPENVIQFQKDLLSNNYSDYATQYGLELEEFLANYIGISDIDAYAENAAKLYLAMQAIAETEGIQVSEDDVKAFFVENNGSEDYSDFEEAYGIEFIKLNVLTSKIVDSLVKGITLK